MHGLQIEFHIAIIFFLKNFAKFTKKHLFNCLFFKKILRVKELQIYFKKALENMFSSRVANKRPPDLQILHYFSNRFSSTAYSAAL